MEVVVVSPDHQLLRQVGDGARVEVCPGAPLLGCLAPRGGQLTVGGTLPDGGDHPGGAASLDGSYSELLVVSTRGDVRLVEVRTEKPGCVSLVWGSECPVERLLNMAEDREITDLSTVVALSSAHTAIAMDLNHYFRTHPDGLLGAEAPGSLKTPDIPLPSFNTDRSWGARMERLYNAARGPDPSSNGPAPSTHGSSPSHDSSHNVSPSQGHAPWFSGLPRVASHLALSQARLSVSRVPPGGATVTFCVPTSSVPSLLSVSQFSALLTFVSPGDGQTSVALWDLESRGVSYHRWGTESGGGLSQVMFDVDQQRLLGRLMVFGKAATVDTLCHLNTWGRCSIPMHALQAGLKNRQLDTVDLFLKSKDNLLSHSDPSPPPAGALLARVQEVCPALDLLCSSIRDGHAESRQFSEQLLRITLTFLSTQLRKACCSTQQFDAEMRSSVSILNRYVFRLWTLMRSFPWPSVQSEPATLNHLTVVGQSEPEHDQSWEHLSTEEVIRQAVLSGHLPRVQAFLRSQERPEQTLEELRRGFSVLQVLHSVALYTHQKELRHFVVEELTRKQYFSPEETQRVEFFREVEELEHPEQVQGAPGLWGLLRLDWVRHWDPDGQRTVLLSRLQDEAVSSCEAETLWSHLTSLHHQHRINRWIQSSQDPSAPRWPHITPQLVRKHTACCSHARERLLNLLARTGVFIHTEGEEPDLLVCRLVQRNLPVLGSRNLEELHPWFHMMLKVQEIPQDLSDPERLFQASLTSAQVLVPGGQPSLSSLLLEGHGVVALASLMFSPGGVDQVVSAMGGPGRSACRLDHQLLKMALGPYPKLRSALFPPGGHRACMGPPDVSIYHLLQSLHPLHPSRLFGWQAANPLLYTEACELPHFSSPHLVSTCALVERRDFLYFLRHSRPSFAYASFLLQEMTGSSSIKLLQPSVAAACLGFLRLLGAPGLGLRVDLRVLRLLLTHWSHKHPASSPHAHRDALVHHGSRLGEAEPGAAQELIGYLEEAVTDSLEQRGIPRSSIEAGQEWAVPVQFSQLHSLALSSVYPSHCAADGQWLHFLLFVQLHSFPPDQVRTLAAQFGPAIQGHLSLALEELSLRGPGWPAPGPRRELLQMALGSQQEGSSWRPLLGEALEQHCPLLSVLAACAQGAEPLQCLCVWVLTSTDDVTAAKATAHLQEAARHRDWTLHDLSIIWKSSLRQGQVKPLLRGFQLFQRLCSEFRNFESAGDKLLLFQRHLLTLRGGGAEGGLPLEWVEAQASVLLTVLFQQSSDHFHLQRLLPLLQHSERHLQANGVDLGVLAQLSVVLQGCPVGLPLGLLSRSSPQLLQEQYQHLLEELQAQGLFSQAQQVAQLARIPADAWLINQLQQDVQSQRSKRRWGREEVRLLFWRRCHQQLQGHTPHPQAASHFFQEQAAFQPLCAQERCLLLGMAGHWLSLVEPLPLQRLEALEKEHWLSGDTGSYEALLEEFSFSKISALNQDSYLSLSEEPRSPAGRVPSLVPLLGPAQRRLLADLIGRLLDEGRVHEACRACRYFSVYLRDVWLVLRCRHLAAGGEANPPAREVMSEPLQDLLVQCHHGNNYCRQILSLYQLSKDLRCSFGELSRVEPQAVLEKLLRCGHPDRYRWAEAFVKDLPPDTVAHFLSNAALHSLQAAQPEPPLDRQVLRLCGDSSLLGRHLLDKISTLRVSQVHCSVELLVLAHDCFSLSCDMEGIVRVLHAARHLSHAHLAPGQHFGLLVRLLTGIGRYDDMTYSSSLKAALLDYIKRCLPGDSEKHNMVALCFSMRREIGENHEMAARTQLKIIHSQPWVVTPQLKSSLSKVLGLLKDAAESYHKDECVRLASRCVRLAKLVLLQLHLLSRGSDQRLVNLQPGETPAAMLALPRCYQAYGQSVDWAELVYQKVVLGGDFVYLEQVKTFCPLTGGLLEDVSNKMCVKEPVGGSSSQNLKRLLGQCEDVVTQYRLAYKHQLHDLAQNLLQDPRSSSYLSDRLSV
ncbi:hypothetical protein NHX12_002321 [Muraenolepis orangiensis]|uniref:Spatacsin C-terminal domain-containing protein n=1 Tax=Muraenolepis orangiensis TaxID=630683 RepID=A0A9Q0DU77_9TELE|nr:hypothetical protein NHX12_002321 [Muraenolepis orangiensis]